MEEPSGLLMQMFGAVRLHFDCARTEMGGDDGAHPRQGPVMTMLLKHEGMSQADLARSLNVTPATVAVSVARLERLGYVARRRNDQNQRANVIALTQAGRREAERLQNALCRVSRVAAQGFSEEELKQMEAFCERMTDNLRAHYSIGEERDRQCTRC